MFQLKKSKDGHSERFNFVVNNKVIVGSFALDYYIDAICYLHSFVILEEFRGNGYSKPMLQLAIKKAYHLGYRVVILAVMRDNRRAKKIYKDAGFVQLSAKRKKNLVTMVLNLKDKAYEYSNCTTLCKTRRKDLQKSDLG